MKLLSLVFAAMMLIHTSAEAISNKQEQMLANLQTIKSIFYTGYAPARWKKTFANWDLNTEIASVENKIRSGRIQSVRDYQQALTLFFNSTKDYHVGIRFFAKESAILPIQIKGVENRYFIVYIDRSKLPLSAFPFNEGDEVIRFAGKPVDEVVMELSAFESNGNPETLKALSELNLTQRKAAKGFPVPRGLVELVILPAGEQNPRTISLPWVYTPESLAFIDDNTNPLNSSEIFDGASIAEESPKKSIHRLFSKKMLAYLDSTTSPSLAAGDNRYAIGGSQSYVPNLGDIIFEHNQGFFHTKIFRTEIGKHVGVVRIPSYGAGAGEAQEFQAIIKLMQQRTDALVIDQVNNPGGSVPFLYSLVSMLTTQPLSTPKHHMALTQQDVVDAENSIKELEKIRNDVEARAMIGDTIGGYPVSFNLAQRLIDYGNFIVNQWVSGKRYTDPFYLVGVDKIEPHPQVNYTKPILILVDNLDFSGGDFFPAIMQDNRRAKVMGTRTAGAGGYVQSMEFQNLMGISSISLTGSLADRINQQPIENLGVTPDIHYRLSIADIQSNGVDFRKAILNALR